MYSLIVAEDCDHYHMKQICTTTKKFSDLSYCIKLHCVEHSFVNDKTNDNSKTLRPSEFTYVTLAIEHSCCHKHGTSQLPLLSEEHPYPTQEGLHARTD